MSAMVYSPEASHLHFVLPISSTGYRRGDSLLYRLCLSIEEFAGRPGPIHDGRPPLQRVVAPSVYPLIIHVC
ncbi:hypothetical protein SAMN06298226_1345 [Nitrosovibrio sp. Nv4]|nr:hypothetical protein SAMN06298226_1345 [Nitrosovibrio sp. Nv4]